MFVSPLLLLLLPSSLAASFLPGDRRRPNWQEERVMINHIYSVKSDLERLMKEYREVPHFFNINLDNCIYTGLQILAEPWDGNVARWLCLQCHGVQSFFNTTVAHDLLKKSLEHKDVALLRDSYDFKFGGNLHAVYLQENGFAHVTIADAQVRQMLATVDQKYWPCFTVYMPILFGISEDVPTDHYRSFYERDIEGLNAVIHLHRHLFPHDNIFSRYQDSCLLRDEVDYFNNLSISLGLEDQFNDWLNQRWGGRMGGFIKTLMDRVKVPEMAPLKTAKFADFATIKAENVLLAELETSLKLPSITSFTDLPIKRAMAEDDEALIRYVMLKGKSLEDCNRVVLVKLFFSALERGKHVPLIKDMVDYGCHGDILEAYLNKYRLKHFTNLPAHLLETVEQLSTFNQDKIWNPLRPIVSDYAINHPLVCEKWFKYVQSVAEFKIVLTFYCLEIISDLKYFDVKKISVEQLDVLHEMNRIYPNRISPFIAQMLPVHQAYLLADKIAPSEEVWSELVKEFRMPAQYRTRFYIDSTLCDLIHQLLKHQIAWMLEHAKQIPLDARFGYLWKYPMDSPLLPLTATDDDDDDDGKAPCFNHLLFYPGTDAFLAPYFERLIQKYGRKVLEDFALARTIRDPPPMKLVMCLRLSDPNYFPERLANCKSFNQFFSLLLPQLLAVFTKSEQGDWLAYLMVKLDKNWVKLN